MSYPIFINFPSVGVHGIVVSGSMHICMISRESGDLIMKQTTLRKSSEKLELLKASKEELRSKSLQIWVQLVYEQVRGGMCVRLKVSQLC